MDQIGDICRCPCHSTFLSTPPEWACFCNCNNGRKAQENKPIVKNSEWVSVEDRLPDKEGEYLCIVKCHSIRIRKFAPWLTGSRLRWWSNGSESKTVTHWMPLPEPPK